MRTPRALSASASALLPGRLQTFDDRPDIGRELVGAGAQCRAAELRRLARPRIAEFEALRFFRASASLVRVLIRARSQADVRRQVLTPGWFGAQSSELSGRTNSLNL